jgi:hypothetical protein
MEFNINILPEAVSEREKSLKALQDMSRGEITNITSRALFREEPLEQRLVSLVQDIETARFWGILSTIDGYWHQTPNFDGMMKEMEATREWARSTFPHHHLEKLLNIVVNQALLRPYVNFAPGTQKPHVVLYEELVEKPGSMFARSVTPDLKRRLNNGRFWESLPEVTCSVNSGAAIRHVEEVLVHHYDALELSFVPKGLLMMKDVMGRMSLEKIALRHIGDTGIEKYQHLVGRIDQAGVADANAVEELLVPYALAVLSWDSDLDCPHFCGVDDDDGHRGMFQLKLQSPVLQKYLARPKLQDRVAEHLARDADTQIFDGVPYYEFVNEALGLMPDRPAVFQRFRDYLEKFGKQEFIYHSRRNGVELETGTTTH